jgi:hypothetical protein
MTSETITGRKSKPRKAMKPGVTLKGWGCLLQLNHDGSVQSGRQRFNAAPRL